MLVSSTCLSDLSIQDLTISDEKGTKRNNRGLSVLDSDDSEIPDMGTKSNVFSLLGGVGGSNKKN